MTKIFELSPQVALMEKWRIDRLNRCAVIIQKFIKMFIYRRQYMKMQEIALKLQTAARAYLARKHLTELRNNAAALKIQSWWKMVHARSQSLEKNAPKFEIPQIFEKKVFKTFFFIIFQNLKIHVKNVYRLKI